MERKANLNRLNQSFRQFLRRHRWAKFLYDVVLVYQDRRVSRSSAELAYYMLMSVFPLLILVIGIVGVLPLRTEQVLNVLSDLLPEQGYDVISEYVGYVLVNLGPALLITGAIAMLGAASAAFRGMISIAGEIFGRRILKGVGYWVASFLYSLLLLLFLYLTMVMVLTGSWFIHMINNLLDIAIPDSLWALTRACFIFSVALLFLMLLYRISYPARRGESPRVMGGAIFAAVAITGFSALFSWFITISNRYSVIYGSVASIIILMVWLYFCATIVISGIVVNYVSWKHREGQEVQLLLERIL